MLFEVLQQLFSLAYQLKQSPARVMIFLVRLEMLCKVADTLGQHTGLPRTGSGQHQYRPDRRGHCLALAIVERKDGLCVDSAHIAAIADRVWATFRAI